MLQVLAIGLGGIIMAVGFSLTAGKFPVIIFAVFASVSAVWFYQDQATRQIRIDRGAVIGVAIGIIGPLVAFGLLGLLAMAGWRPAEDLTTLSNTYEGVGLSTSEISVIYNIYVGDPVLNDVELHFFLLTALVGLVFGAITAAALGGWSVRDSYLREKLYNWRLLYRPGESVDLPADVTKRLRLAKSLFIVQCAGSAIALVLDVILGKGVLNLLVLIFYMAPLGFVSLITALVYFLFIFAIPSTGNYRPARAKLAAMAVLSVGLLMALVMVIDR